MTDAEWDELEKEPNAHFEVSWKTLLNRPIDQSRQILAKLFGGGPVPFIPTRSGIEFSGITQAGKLLIDEARIGVPNGDRQTTERLLSFTIDLQVAAA